MGRLAQHSPGSVVGLAGHDGINWLANGVELPNLVLTKLAQESPADWAWQA